MIIFYFFAFDYEDVHRIISLKNRIVNNINYKEVENPCLPFTFSVNN